MSITIPLGTCLGILRTLRGWSQRELGHQVHLSQQQMHNREHHVTRLTAEELPVLAAALQVDVVAFYDDAALLAILRAAPQEAQRRVATQFSQHYTLLVAQRECAPG